MKAYNASRLRAEVVALGFGKSGVAVTTYVSNPPRSIQRKSLIALKHQVMFKVSRLESITVITRGAQNVVRHRS